MGDGFYSTYGENVVGEFPRESTTTDFGSGGAGAADIQTDEADAMTQGALGRTNIFGENDPALGNDIFKEWPEQAPNLSN